MKKLVDDCINCQPSRSLRPHDAISALSPMYEVHEKNHLPKVQSCDHVVMKLLDNCTAKKNEMNTIVHFCMQKVKSAQLNIKDMMNELHAFQEVMGHQEKEFDNLKLVNGIGHAYRACLAEVVRRKSSSKLYMGLAGQLAERLAAERENEIRRREGFCKAWNKYIPNDILASMGLFDSPSQCDVNIVPFDTHLIDIDVNDVDRYAPQSVIGIQSRYERSKSSRSYRETSVGSSILTISEENPIDERVDIEGLIEACLPGDISGTSKLEVENARLKAELASAIAVICVFNAEIGYETFDEVESSNLLKSMKDKTAEALRSKDEYIKHIRSMLNMKQVQCLTYEKRIHELEQRLADQYNAGRKISIDKNASESLISTLKIDDYRGDIYGDEEAPNAYVSTVTMEEASCTSASVDPRLDLLSTLPGKLGEGGDENMIDLSCMLNASSLHTSHKVIDASMLEPLHNDHQAGDDDDEEEGRVGRVDKDEVGETDMESGKEAPQFSLTTVNSDISTVVDSILPCGNETNHSLESKINDNVVLDLQRTLAERSSQFDMAESKLKAALEEMGSLKRELEIRRNLLDESQVSWTG